jgi:hypothetical protein
MLRKIAVADTTRLLRGYTLLKHRGTWCDSNFSSTRGCFASFRRGWKVRFLALPLLLGNATTLAYATRRPRLPDDLMNIFNRCLSENWVVCRFTYVRLTCSRHVWTHRNEQPAQTLDANISITVINRLTKSYSCFPHGVQRTETRTETRT